MFKCNQSNLAMLCDLALLPLAHLPKKMSASCLATSDSPSSLPRAFSCSSHLLPNASCADGGHRRATMGRLDASTGESTN